MKKNFADGKYGTAAGRWAGMGPYYAMFPVEFANRAVKEFTSPGQWVLDPFAGRGTSLYAAATQGRHAVGIEINPVGWLYAQAKLSPALRSHVIKRVEELGVQAAEFRSDARILPTFFHRCFSPGVREFLLASRELLKWRSSKIDWTTMALLLVDLHGKRGDALSNQMRQTKAMSPGYAVSWWKARDMRPPVIDPVEFVSRKVEWRYKRGRFQAAKSKVYLGDSRLLLPKLAGNLKDKKVAKASLLLTSPPYFGITNYFYDQWLRLWMLGGREYPKSQESDIKCKFENRENYQLLLDGVFSNASKLLTKDAVICVRTDSRSFTLEATRAALIKAFPHKKIRRAKHSTPVFSQTQLYRNRASGVGETDLIMW